MNSKSCIVCGTQLTGRQSLYCKCCSIVKDKERKKNWVLKRNPNAYKPKEEKFCSVCGGKFACYFNNVPYCNKHYLRMYTNGTTELIKRKSKNEVHVVGDIAYLKTTKGVTFKIDLIDLPSVSKYTWCQNKSGGYLVANVNNRVVRLSRYLLNPPKNLFVDHINGDILDNTRTNLRACPPTGNSRNCNISKNNSTGYPGISRVNSGKFRARIMVNRRELFLGLFNTIEEAIEVRKAAELQYFKEFAPSICVLKKD